jgi:hypothetical protein
MHVAASGGWGFFTVSSKKTNASGGSGTAASFLAAALEDSSNSSRLDAKLALWSTLWQPLLPQHWLRAILAAGAKG